MNFILAEERNYPLGSFVSSIRAQKIFAESSIVVVNNNNISEIRKDIVTRPVLNRSWLLLLYLRDYTEQLIEAFASDENAVVFVVRNREDMISIQRSFKRMGLEYTLVNNLSPEPEQVSEYIKSELPHITGKFVTLLMDRYSYKIKGENRPHFYLNALVGAVETLKDFPKITAQIIRDYTTKRSDVNYNKFFNYIIGAPGACTAAQAGALVNKYRYGYRYLFNAMLKRLKLYLMLYDDISIGVLTNNNFSDYHEKNSKRLDKVSLYIVKQALLAFSHVSYDKVYLLHTLYAKEEKEGVSLLGFLGLLQLSK